MRGSALCFSASEGHLAVEWVVNLGAGMKEVLKKLLFNVCRGFMELISPSETTVFAQVFHVWFS